MPLVFAIVPRPCRSVLADSHALSNANLTFLCLDANDPDYTHGKIQTTVSN
jgi:hypothetical protein